MNKTALAILMALLMMALAFKIQANPTLWACSNHKPAHIATSTAQLQELTDRYGCRGWYVLK